MSLTTTALTRRQSTDFVQQPMLQVARESSGRRFVTICPQLSEVFQDVVSVLSASQTIDKTVSGGIANFFYAVANPQYVQHVNTGLEKLRGSVNGPQFLQLNQRMQQLFLAKALQWTDAISCANAISGVQDFENRKLEAFQAQLIDKGASREYTQVLDFFEGIAHIAFREGGPLFRYPSFTSHDEHKEKDPNGILMRKGGNWLLAPVKNAPDQKNVLDELNKVVDAFRSFEADGTAEQLSDDELLLGLALVGQVMANYLKQIDDVPEVGHEVFHQLCQLHQLMHQHLNGRASRGLEIQLDEETLNELIETFGVLRNVLSKPQFCDFYSKADKIALLEEAEQLIGPFITFHLNPDYISSRHKWTMICQQNGINLYKTPKKELVVFFNQHDSFWERQKFNAFSMIGGRGTDFGELNGLVHQQSLDGAYQARGIFHKMLQAREKEIGSYHAIRFVGYGLDGTVAQLLGYDHKKYNAELDVMVIGAGVPPFLNQAAAADMGNTMRNQKGFHCINYSMAADPNMSNLGVTGPLGMRYDNSSFVTVPVPQGVVFASEGIKGDMRKAYLQMIRIGNRMHFAMRNLYLQVEEAQQLLKKVKPIQTLRIEELANDDYLLI